MRHIAGLFRLFLLGLLILLILLAILFVFPFASLERRGRLIKRLARLIPAALGMKVAVKGRVPDAGAAAAGFSESGLGYMVCANHISFADIFVIDGVLPVRFVAKQEIGGWPIFGFISTSAGTIYIDRSRRRSVLEVAEKMTDAVKAGQSVLFFPEGTTGPGDKLLPFHSNLFSAACRSGAAVLPIAVRYVLDGETSVVASYADAPLFDVLKRIVFTPGICAEVTVLDPIDSAQRDRRSLCALASKAVSEALDLPDATAERDDALKRLHEGRLKTFREKERPKEEKKESNQGEAAV